MIRKAQNDDYDDILRLWDMCFGEDRVFNEWFFKNRFKISETVVYEKDSKIVAMIQLMPYELKNIGKVGYIYGACTDIEFRKCGFMAELLRYAEKLCGTLILIPQNEDLFKFYEKFGYKPCTFIDAKALDENMNYREVEIYKACDDDIAEINHIYEKSFENFILRDDSYWKIQIKMFNETGGNVFCMKESGIVTGYAFVWDNGFIQEIAVLNDKKYDFAYSIGKVTGRKIKTAEISEKPFACINGENIRVYINLMFN